MTSGFGFAGGASKTRKKSGRQPVKLPREQGVFLFRSQLAFGRSHFRRFLTHEWHKVGPLGKP